jgi:tetratricopeptide (TPR) repeat protein
MSSRSSSSNFADEQIAAHTRAAHLVGLPWPERLRIVREDRSYAIPGFIELAISLAREVGMPHTEREEWAQLGVAAARRCGARRAAELEPLAWAVLAGARRLRGNLVASHAAFRRCAALRRHLIVPLELAETYDLEAAYWWTVKEPARGTELIREALRLAREHGTDVVIGSYQIRAASIATEAADWSNAITILLSALDRLDPAESPRLALAAGHNLVWTAIRLGHLDTAMSAILRLNSHYEALAEPGMLTRRDWLLADIARARGHWRETELRLHSVRESLTELEMHLGVARIDLDLAKLPSRRPGRRAKPGRRPACLERPL